MFLLVDIYIIYVEGVLVWFWQDMCDFKSGKGLF